MKEKQEIVPHLFNHFFNNQKLRKCVLTTIDGKYTNVINEKEKKYRTTLFTKNEYKFRFSKG